MMQGKRVDWNDGRILEAGEYAKSPSGVWYCCTPNGHMGNLGGHTVTEHENGTISASPSILVSVTNNGKRIPLWHGYLEKGIWREC